MEELSPNDPSRIGPYRLTHLLGVGGMGKVYLGRTSSGRKIVVKSIRPEFVSNPEFRARFAREVRAAQKVGGFHTAQVVEADTEAEEPWIASAYIPGPSLRQTITEHGPLPDSALRVLAAGLAEGLRVIHGHGLSHRDLKPGNILLADDGPRIIDFGIARPAEDTRITLTGVLLGTPSYMAPEQTDGAPAEPSADVFSLGTVLHYAATGSNPFTAPNVTTTIRRLISPAPDVPVRVPADIRELIIRCWQQDPSKRPGVDEILQLLGEIEANEAWPPFSVHKVPDRFGINMFTPDATEHPLTPDVLELRVQAFKELVEEGQYTEAILGLEGLLAQVRESYSYDDVVVAEASSALAHCKARGWDFEAAAALLRLAIPARVEQLRSDGTHENLQQLLQTRTQLALYLRQADQVEEARKALLTLLSDQLHHLGPEHPSILRTRYTAAHYLIELKYFSSARREFREMFPEHIRILGAGHPDTLAVEHQILHCTGRLGDWQAALQGFEDLVPVVNARSGPQDLFTLMGRANIALWRATGGDLETALKEYAEVLPDMVEALGDHHPNTRKVREQEEHFRNMLMANPPPEPVVHNPELDPEDA